MGNNAMTWEDKRNTILVGLQSLVGQTFGYWTIVEPLFIESGIKRKRLRKGFRCKCRCGEIKDIIYLDLIDGRTTSCGCSYQHGMSTTPTWNSWDGMIKRCSNPKHTYYPRYGGRGIKVCDRWKVFQNFFQDMGVRPEGKTLDRIDNDGDYEPINCRWATQSEQVRNSSSAGEITHDGKTLSVIEWAELIGINPATIHQRLRLGWPIDKALSHPVRHRRPNKSQP